MTTLKLYKAQFVQKLDEENLQDRTVIPMLEDRKVSNEATFYLHQLANKHNIRYWCETNPRITY